MVVLFGQQYSLKVKSLLSETTSKTPVYNSLEITGQLRSKVAFLVVSPYVVFVVLALLFGLLHIEPGILLPAVLYCIVYSISLIVIISDVNLFKFAAIFVALGSFITL